MNTISDVYSPKFDSKKMQNLSILRQSHLKHKIENLFINPTLNSKNLNSYVTPKNKNVKISFNDRSSTRHYTNSSSPSIFFDNSGMLKNNDLNIKNNFYQNYFSNIGNKVILKGASKSYSKKKQYNKLINENKNDFFINEIKEIDNINHIEKKNLNSKKEKRKKRNLILQIEELKDESKHNENNLENVQLNLEKEKDNNDNLNKDSLNNSNKLKIHNNHSLSLMNIDEIITLKKSQRRKRNLTKIKSEYQNLIVNNTNNYNNLKIETNIGENDINERNNTENKKIPLRKFSEEPIINYKKHFNIDNITLSNEKSENETIYNNLNTQSIENNIKKLQKKNSKIKEGNYIKVSLGYSKAGKDDNKNIKTNQDSYFILEKINGLNFNIYGIFDGHGSSGHLISKFISNYLLNYYKYNEEIKSKKNIESIYLLLKKKNYSFIKNSIKKSEESLFDSDEIDSSFSGTTCILIFILGNKIISINIGDSRAIMIKENKNYIQLSIDHKPENKEEKERIEKNGGELRKIIQNNEEIGPIRVWVKGKKYPGIAMSRSIGDSVANEIGVFSLPEIKEFYIQNNCKFIVIGSDGLWEFLENEKVVRYVNKFNDILFINEYIENLVSKAVKYWEKYDVIVDDITCILIVFNNEDL